MEEDKQDKRKNSDDLEDLLTEAAQQTAIRAATKRKAVEEALLQPSMLKMLEELVTDLERSPLRFRGGGVPEFDGTGVPFQGTAL